MNIYKINSITECIKGNSYVGRGIIIGKTADAKKAAVAYFIMGRSENSRNRIFAEKDNCIFTEPFDASKVVGRPKNGFEEKFSLAPVAKHLSELLNHEVIFTQELLGEKVIEIARNLKGGEIFLLENVRFSLYHDQESSY